MEKAAAAFEGLSAIAATPATIPVAGAGVEIPVFTTSDVMYWLNSSYVNTAVSTAHGGFVGLCGLGYWYGIDAVIDAAKDLGIWLKINQLNLNR